MPSGDGEFSGPPTPAHSNLESFARWTFRGVFRIFVWGFLGFALWVFSHIVITHYALKTGRFSYAERDGLHEWKDLPSYFLAAAIWLVFWIVTHP